MRDFVRLPYQKPIRNLHQDMSEQLKTEPVQSIPRATVLDLSLTQLIAGSLAAATAAALGSRLGILGTISGAAIGSVVSAIASHLYTTSMTRARAALQWQKAHTRRSEAPLGVVAASPASSSAQFEPSPRRSRAQIRPAPHGRRLLAGAAAVFALATTFLLGLQLASGTDVTGTSLGDRQAAAQPDPPGEPDPGRRADPAAADPAPTATPTDVPATPSSRVVTTGPGAPPTGIGTDPSAPPGPVVTTPPEQPSPSDSPPTTTTPTAGSM